ncbi:MAG TPA: aspartyl-tRNA amidotransferase [Deltaproteobacteria bacterium]|nr:MAG: aspartyl-tRNA amidotransferase [Deltaproteobacteria bacterium GWA2_55_82]OIJ73812.1 MAG: aspartyl-tRNA amidotransferase [Deltaproteobacteria bacterium GWC2_55_46]HBG45782.1 aspartyl-tRNA amidotransferase [Deltaproteobacteria bacterium]HCY09799.1 aspartyl-tRNA amidotransferase [Deltaproteobacteria bacterium]
MSLREQVTKDMAVALKAGEKARLSTLRMLMSAIKYKEVDAKHQLDDEEVISVISTLIKQRHDSIDQFRKGGREDLVDKETKEVEVLKGYLPPQLSEEEVRNIITKAAAETGATGQKDMGKLMKAVMPQVKGKADGKLVNEIVKEVLGA